MINSLYTFSTNAYVVAEEWNANFDVLAQSNSECAKAIQDANDVLAFPNEDLSQLYGTVKKQPNSFNVPGLTVIVAPECEYYKTLGSGEDLNITIPEGLNGEVRIVIKTTGNRTLKPFSINYNGVLHESVGLYNIFNAGTYFILIYEINGHAYVKLIWTREA